MDDSAHSDPAIQEACEFILHSLPTHISSLAPTELAAKLKDGVLLCELVNSVSPGMIPKISTKSLPFLRMENINNALKSCRELGVGTEDLFEMRDVFEERAVARCILALKRIKSSGSLQSSVGKGQPRTSAPTLPAARPPAVPRSATSGTLLKHQQLPSTTTTTTANATTTTTTTTTNSNNTSSTPITSSLSRISSPAVSPPPPLTGTIKPNSSIANRIAALSTLPPPLTANMRPSVYSNQSLQDLPAAPSATGSASASTSDLKAAGIGGADYKIVSLHNITVSISPAHQSADSGAAKAGEQKSDSIRKSDTRKPSKRTKQGRRLSHASQISQSAELLKKPLAIEEDGQTTEYQIGECVGKGQFGVVYRSVNPSTGTVVAIKRIKMDAQNQSELESLMTEVDLLRSLQHENIIRYQGCKQQDGFLNIILEFAENGSLRNTIRQFGALPERLAVYYAAGVLDGLVYLHQRNVIHCDLKAANILTTKSGVVKLTDFGVSKKVLFDEKDISVAGTPNWMAPEIIELKGATTASDIWSLGCTLVEFITSKPPYANCNAMTALFRIVEETMPVPETVSPELQDFLRQCFNKDPLKRPSAEQLLQHPWIAKNREEIDSRRRAAGLNGVAVTKSLQDLSAVDSTSVHTSPAHERSALSRSNLYNSSEQLPSLEQSFTAPPAIANGQESMLEADQAEMPNQTTTTAPPRVPGRSTSSLHVPNSVPNRSSVPLPTANDTSYTTNPRRPVSTLSPRGSNSQIRVHPPSPRSQSLIASNTAATKSHDSGTDGSALPDQPYPPGPAGNQRQAMAAGSIIDGGVIGESGNDQSEAANNLTVSSQFQSAEYQNSVGRKSSKLRRKDWKGSDIAKEDKNKKKKRGGCQIL